MVTRKLLSKAALVAAKSGPCFPTPKFFWKNQNRMPTNLKLSSFRSFSPRRVPRGDLRPLEAIEGPNQMEFGFTRTHLRGLRGAAYRQAPPSRLTQAYRNTACNIQRNKGFLYHAEALRPPQASSCTDSPNFRHREHAKAEVLHLSVGFSFPAGKTRGNRRVRDVK